MDGHTIGVDSCHTSRGDHDHSFLRVVSQLAQEGSLACSCFARQEDVPLGVHGVLIRQFKLLVSHIMATLGC